MNDNKNFADKATRAARETFEKGSAATQQSAGGAQESFSAVAEGIRDFNVQTDGDGSNCDLRQEAHSFLMGTPSS